MEKILIAEDDDDVYYAISESLKSDFSLVRSRTKEEAEGWIKTSAFSALILDIHFPDGNIFSSVKKISSNPLNWGSPILFITSADDQSKLQVAFELGADDYIKKPFSPEELKSRVVARINKRKRELSRSNTLKLENNHSNFSVQFSNDTAILSDNDTAPSKYRLTLTEKTMFEALIKNSPQILTRENLLNAIPTKKEKDDMRLVDAHIKNLRRKIGPFSKYIRSSYGQGYFFAIPS